MKYFFVFTLFCSFLGNAQSYIDFHFKSNGITGAVVIYNDNTNEWIFNNESEPFTNTPIAAHFHLWQTLVGLENGVFSTKENDVIRWDGVKRSYFEEHKSIWNKDMNLSEAIANQNDSYFNHLKYRLSKEIYQSNIEENSLIKQTLNNKLEFYWNYAALTNPNTLILFLKDLYENKLPFNKQNQEYLIKQLKISNDFILHSTVTSYQGNKIEWTIGAYLKNKKPVYFSYRTNRSVEFDKTSDYDKKRNQVLTEIFESLKI